VKVCIVNSYYPPWIGGAETYTKNLARSLSRRGHKVTVYCSDRPLRSGVSFEDGIEIVRMRTPAAFYGTPVVFFPPKILKEDYDVIHANFPSPYLAAVSSWISAVRNIPAVLTWHNDLPPVTSGAGLLVKLHDLVSGSYLDAYRRIIATTEVYSKRSKTLQRYRDKVVVIQNGVDTGRFNPEVDGGQVRERFGLKEGTKVVLFVGALTTWHAYKGVDVLLKAFQLVSKKHGDAKLLIVGGGELLEYYRSLSVELGLASSSVLFAGRVDDEALPQYYSACDVAVLPSKDSSEGFGLVLLEAMACGKPVIGSKVGGIVEVIDDGGNGLLVEPNDVGQLAHAIEIMLSDDERRISMGHAGRVFAKSRDWGVVAGRVGSVYSSVCESEMIKSMNGVAPLDTLLSVFPIQDQIRRKQKLHGGNRFAPKSMIN